MAGGQNDPEVAEAFRQAWIAPRRAEAREALSRHCRSGELPAGLDLDLAVEMMYSPLYYRLLTGYGGLTTQHVEAVARTVLDGLRNPESTRT